MSEHDQLLIDKAYKFVDGSDWNEVSLLEKQVESDEAREIIHNHKTYLFHREEYFADNY